MDIFDEAVRQQDDTDEVLALGRMVSYVCQRSKVLNLTMSTYFLEMALTSLVNDIGERDMLDTGAEHVIVVPSANELH